MSLLEIEIYAARGESLADISRRTGAYGVGPYDSDSVALQKFATAFAAVALATSPGIKGDPGSAGEGFATVAALATAGNAAGDRDDAYLTEAGREGKWVFSASDLSAFVAVDAGQALFIAKDSDATGATGAWVRVVDGPGKATWAGAMSAEAMERMANAGIPGGLSGDMLVETAPYPTATGLVLDNASIRNTNATSLSVNDYKQTALSVGFMAGQATYDATPDAVSAYSTDRRTLTLPAGEGAKYVVGDPVLVHGATVMDVASGASTLRFPRNFRWTWVVDKSADTITLDSPVPADVIGDGPFVVFQTNEIDATAYVSGDRTPANFHVVRDWVLRNVRLASDKGDPMKWGGAINLRASDLYVEGRHGLSLNAMQDCLFERIHGRFWRAAIECAQNSRGTTIRGVRLWQEDSSAKYGGGSDQSTFIQHLGENSRDVLVDDCVVHADFNNSNANAIIFGAGHNLSVRNFYYSLARYTGSLVGFSSGDAAGKTERMGLESGEIRGGASVQYFQFRTLSGVSTKECFLRDVRFTGAVSVRAGIVEGIEGGEIVGVKCDAGALLFNGATTGWTIERNHFPGGFQSLTQTILNSNLIRDNTSDVSLRFEAAAIVSQAVAVVSATAANTLYQRLAVAAGDLQTLDEVHLRVEAYAAGLTGSHTRHIRVVATFGAAAPVEVIDLTETEYAAAEFVEVVLLVQNFAFMTALVRWGNSTGVHAKYVNLGPGNLNTAGLNLDVEIWGDSGTSTVVTEFVAAAQKVGMRNVPVLRGARP